MGEGEAARRVIDRLWLWGHVASAYNDYRWLKDNGWKSTIEPVDACDYMGLQNMIFIHWNADSKPTPPYDDYFIPFKKLDKVIWSITGADGSTSPKLREHVDQLAQKNPNIVGFVMDDFFKSTDEPADSPLPYPAAMTPEEVREYGKRKIRDKALPITLGIYTRELTPRAEEHLRAAGQAVMFTWKPEDINILEENLEKLEKLMGGGKILLNCYVYDFDISKPMPVALMEKQCTLGLRWLKQGRIAGMVFLGSPVVDLKLEAVEWTRKWIAEVSHEPL